MGCILEKQNDKKENGRGKSDRREEKIDSACTEWSTHVCAQNHRHMLFFAWNHHVQSCMHFLLWFAPISMMTSSKKTENPKLTLFFCTHWLTLKQQRRRSKIQNRDHWDQRQPESLLCIRQCVQQKGVLGVFSFWELKVVFTVEVNHNKHNPQSVFLLQQCIVLTWLPLQS